MYWNAIQLIVLPFIVYRSGTIWGNAVKHPVCLVYPPRNRQSHQDLNHRLNRTHRTHPVTVSVRHIMSDEHNDGLISWSRSLSARAWTVDAMVTITPETVCLLFCHLYSRQPQCKYLLAQMICQHDKIPVAGVKRWLLEDTIFTHGEYNRTVRYMLSGDTNGMWMLTWRRAQPHPTSYNGSCRIKSQWDGVITTTPEAHLCNIHVYVISSCVENYIYFCWVLVCVITFIISSSADSASSAYDEHQGKFHVSLFLTFVFCSTACR